MLTPGDSSGEILEFWERGPVNRVSSSFSWSKREERTLSSIEDCARQDCFLKRRVDGITHLFRPEDSLMDVSP